MVPTRVKLSLSIWVKILTEVEWECNLTKFKSSVLETEPNELDGLV